MLYHFFPFFLSVSLCYSGGCGTQSTEPAIVVFCCYFSCICLACLSLLYLWQYYVSQLIIIVLHWNVVLGIAHNLIELLD
jgi:hypothetical protein